MFDSRAMLVKIRKEIEERGITDDFPAFSFSTRSHAENVSPVTAQEGSRPVKHYQYDDEVIESGLVRMRANADNRARRAIFSHRKVIGPLIVFYKKVCRKLLKWYLEPVCDQQSEYNHAAVGVTENLQQHLLDLEERMRGASDRIVGNEVRLFVQEDSMRAVNGKIDDIISTNQERDRQYKKLEASIGEIVDRNADLEQSNNERFSRQDEALADQESRIGEIVDRSADLEQRNNERFSRQDEALADQKNRIGEIVNRNADLEQRYNERIAKQENALWEMVERNDRDRHSIDERFSGTTDRIIGLEQRYTEIVKSLSQIESKMESRVQALLPKYEFGHVVSSSQSGEDAIVAYILDALKIPFKDCTYLDLGANHAKFMSNSYFFYRFGARGVLVEANPDLIVELEAFRQGDVILNNCIAQKSGEQVRFFVMNGDGLSSPDIEYVHECIRQNSNLYVTKQAIIETISIQDILKKYFHEPPTLVNLDIEGGELQLLEDFNLPVYRPLCFIVETINYSPRLQVPVKNMEIINYMQSVGYVEYAFTGINSIFVDKHRLSESMVETSVEEA